MWGFRKLRIKSEISLFHPKITRAVEGVCQKMSGGMVIVLFQNEDMGPSCRSNTPEEVNLAVHQPDVNNVERTYPRCQKMNKIIIFLS